MRIFNVIVVHDVYIAVDDGEDEAAARAGVLSLIQTSDEPLAASEQNALQVTHERSIRDAWRSEKILVSGGVSDADFEQLKGKSTLEVYELLHTKAGADKEAAKATKK